MRYVGSGSVYCLNRKVFSCVIKVSTEISVDRSAVGIKFHVDRPQTK